MGDDLLSRHLEMHEELVLCDCYPMCNFIPFGKYGQAILELVLEWYYCLNICTFNFVCESSFVFFEVVGTSNRSCNDACHSLRHGNLNGYSRCQRS